MLKKNWVYKTDEEKHGRMDVWVFIQPNEQGKYVGDCEDFSFTWLALEKGSVKDALVAILLGEAKIWYVDNGGGHAVLEYKGQFIDNWTGILVSLAYMEKLGHKFKFVFSRPVVFYKLLMGYFHSLKK